MSSMCHVTKKAYTINFAFNCDLYNVVYLFDCVVRVALAHHLGIDLITTRRAIVSLFQGLKFLRWTSLDISLRRTIMGFWKTLVLRQ